MQNSQQPEKSGFRIWRDSEGKLHAEPFGNPPNSLTAEQFRPFFEIVRKHVEKSRLESPADSVGPQTADKPSLKPKEIAADLRVTVEKVLAWIHSGELAAINVGRGKLKPRYRIDPAAYQAFKEKRAAVPVEVLPPVEDKPFRRRFLGPRS